jgi:IS605 OrfB family transposase
MSTVDPNANAIPGPPARPPQVLTRRIQILVQGETKEETRAAWQKLTDWQRIVARAANWIATHHYVQENLKELFYLTDGTRVKLADVKKDESGILTTSRMNTTYRLLSEKFKGQIPMAIISSLNRRIVSVFDKEKLEYREGTRSLRTYKAGLPIPIAGSDLIHLALTDGGDYNFVLYGLHFRTNLGRDKSGNAGVMQQLLEGKIKLLNSTLEIRKHKIFLLAAFPVEERHVQLSPDIRVTAHLSVSIPIVAETGQERIEIGTREEFLHRRLAIQEGMQRMQTTMSTNRGGKGRKKKMQALERFHDKEKNYVNTRLHQYSARLIAICLRHSAGLLVLHGQSEKEARTQEDEFLLRNWSYYGLKEKISYKAAKYGITVVTR